MLHVTSKIFLAQMCKINHDLVTLNKMEYGWSRIEHLYTRYLYSIFLTGRTYFGCQFVFAGLKDRVVARCNDPTEVFLFEEKLNTIIYDQHVLII